jgi:hypothetical protein
MQKFRILKKSEEIARATETLEKGLCFITKQPLGDKAYDLMWHAGADTHVYVEQSYLKSKLQKEQIN